MVIMTSRAVLALLLGPLTVSVQSPVRDTLVVFVGANVLSMRSPEVTPNQTVVVRGGVIAAVGPANRMKVPPGALRIDARGKYLMPGLADFHTHVVERGDLTLYLASGVTTIANMGSPERALTFWRDSIRAGQMSGPEIYVGAYVNGPAGVGGMSNAATVEDARRLVSEAARDRYDFIKVYNSLTAEQFAAVMDEAKARRLPVLGHAVRSVGIERGLAMGQVAIVHAEEYGYAELRGHRDSASIERAVAFTREHDATLVPNLSAFEVITLQWGKPAVVDSFFALPEIAQLSEYWRSRWRGADYITRRGTLDALPFLKRLTAAMQRGGVRLLLGTDSPSIPGMFAGPSIHNELRLLVESGLTPYEALVAGTRAAGEFATRQFGAERAGLVVPGYRADLILLAANPLQDIRNSRATLGVMSRGQWRQSVATLP